MSHARFDQRAGASARDWARKQRAKTPGFSRGGFTSKLHTVVGALGSPLQLALMPSQQAGCTVAANLLASLAVVAKIAQASAAVVVPSKRSGHTVFSLDQNVYADRNKAERFFNRLKQHRRLATRYDKLAASFLAFALRYYFRMVALIINMS